MRLTLAILFVALPVVRAQNDLIGVTFTGQSVAFDSRTGAGVLLTTNAVTGQNAMARVGNTLYSTDRTVQGVNVRFGLGRLDPITGAYTQLHPDVGDLRGLAAHPTNPQLLFGIMQNDPDLLVVVNVGTGARTILGSTGQNGIQALCLYQNRLLAWDVNAGLMLVNQNTGLATDLNSNVGGSGGVQFLTAMSDGRLIGGQQALVDIDPQSGVTHGFAALAGGTFDVRGVEERMPLIDPFGTGCNNVQNVASTLLATGPALPSTTLSLTSNRHEPQHLAVLILGFDLRHAQNQILPFLLDPMLGTNGCRLFTSIDLTAVALTSGLGSFQMALNLPANMGGATFALQVAVFETVPGGMSWSNGVLVKVGS